MLLLFEIFSVSMLGLVMVLVPLVAVSSFEKESLDPLRVVGAVDPLSSNSFPTGRQLVVDCLNPEMAKFNFYLKIF
jgi:hypothetical protein